MTTTPSGPEAGAGWRDDPTRRYRYRYWNGTAWTEHVSAGDGSATTDPQPVTDTDDERAELFDQLQRALASYDQLLQDLGAERIDEDTFRRRAFQAGLVVRDDEAWILDLTHSKWHRYDGIELQEVLVPDSEA